jgi:hypothetical protein
MPDQPPESVLDTFFNNYAMGLWSLLIIALVLNVYGIISDNQYFTLTSIWSPPLIILLPLLQLNPRITRKIYKPLMFIATSIIMFIFNAIVTDNQLSLLTLAVDFFITMFLGLLIILSWTLINTILHKKLGYFMSIIVTSLIIISSSLMIGFTLGKAI